MTEFHEEIELIDIRTRLDDINRRRINATVEHHHRIHQAVAGVIVCCVLAGVFAARAVPQSHHQFKLEQEVVYHD